MKKNIIDTNFEKKESGIVISLYNQKNEQLGKEYINNLIFMYNSEKYYASDKNVVQINLGNVTAQKTKNLTIRTKENDNSLENGTYYIKIQKYLSSNGYQYDSLYEDVIIIPLIIENKIHQVVEHNFSVMLNKESN